jgi:hypothetical protein
VTKLLQKVGLDRHLHSGQTGEYVERISPGASPSRLIASVVFWFIFLFVLSAAIGALQIPAVTAFMNQVLAYLPNVIVAVLILLVAAVLADVVQRVVAGSAAAANLRSANLLGSLARWAIWIFAILAALNQLQIANDFIQPLFTGLVVALALAFGLSFGLGGQQAASRVIERMHEQTR